MSEDDHKLETVPFDPRFPNTNQTLNCFTNYVDYFRCLDLLNESSKCETFKKRYTVLCPNAWVAKWDEQREIGTFPGQIIRVPKDYCEQKKAKKNI